MNTRPWLVTASLVVLIAGCGSEANGENAGDAVTRADFEGDGRTWPLTIDSGTLACEPGSRITIAADGTTYAVNGAAKGDGEWAEIDEIWADNPSIPGTKVNISDLIEAGQELCE